MLTLPPSVRVFVCLKPADMRRSLDGLTAMTREILREDPLSGHLFVYFNRLVRESFLAPFSAGIRSRVPALVKLARRAGKDSRRPRHEMGIL